MSTVAGTIRSRLSTKEIEQLDPYMLMGMLGKRVIHPGGRKSTEELFKSGDFQRGQQVLDIGAGLGRRQSRSPGVLGHMWSRLIFPR